MFSNVVASNGESRNEVRTYTFQFEKIFSSAMEFSRFISTLNESKQSQLK